MQKRNPRRRERIARGASCALLVGLFTASGCNDEVGGDGFIPDRPSAGKGGLAGSAASAGGAGNFSDGGVPADGGAGREPTTPPGGKAGSASHAGTGGKGGGHAGTATTDGGMGGETAGAECGNHTVEPPEQCDDGNTKSGDGCTADCKSDCEVCEKTYCKAVRAHDAGEYSWIQESVKQPFDLPASCFEMPGLAEAGPAQGVPRKDLCLAMLDCIRREKCSQLIADDFGGVSNSYLKSSAYPFMRCFCDLDVTDPAYITKCVRPADFVPGKCSREILEASERDDPALAFNGLNTLGKPMGVANSLLQACDKKLCTEECLPEFSIGIVTEISASIVTAKNEAGESPLGDLIADAQRAVMATDFAFVNDGAFISEYSSRGLIFGAAPGRPADANGRVLESEIRQVVFGMIPDGNATNAEGGSKLVTLSLTGQQVYDFLQANYMATQVSGLSFTWDGATSQVLEVKKAGAPIDKAAIYSVTINDSFARAVVGATNVVTLEKSPEQELVSYLKAQPRPIAPPTLNRITRVN